MIVFPMAGISSRFTERGYSVPKFQLSIWNAYVFDFAVGSFVKFFESEKFLFIYRETGGARLFIEDRVERLGIREAVLVELKAATSGQAETVEVGLKAAGVSKMTPLTIFNIDTFRCPYLELASSSSAFSGCLEVFRGSGDNWSFVKPDSNVPKLVSQTAEKQAISDLCSNGLYYFSSVDVFREALALEREMPSMSELYIAPIYNHLILRGHKVTFVEIQIDDIFFCGVPSEYEALSRREKPWRLNADRDG